MDDGLKLLKEWFKESGDPWVEDDYGHINCFFCGESEPDHSLNCFFIKAKLLVKGCRLTKE